jgi:hypothetical protein
MPNWRAPLLPPCTKAHDNVVFGEVPHDVLGIHAAALAQQHHATAGAGSLADAKGSLCVTVAQPSSRFDSGAWL